MKPSVQRIIEVWADWTAQVQPLRLGTLTAMTGRRIHFASAMTLLDRSDGDDASTGASYLELAELLLKQGAHADRDLEQLWRRIASLSVCPILTIICVTTAFCWRKADGHSPPPMI